jgi:Secretion system C-terminal sorting domain
MKRFISVLIVSFVFFNLTYGKQLDERIAKTVGQKFLTSQVNSRTLKSSNDLAMVQSNTIELNAAMTVTPGTTLIQGQSVSVHLDVRNTGSATFTGKFDVSLYNLDGSLAFTVQQMTGINMPSNYHYPNGLIFANPNVTCAPGSYQLAMQYFPDSGLSWQLADSTDYPNPIEVIVLQTPLGIDDASLNAVRIHPNPVKDVLHLDLISVNGNFNQIQIMNLEGKQVLNVFKVSGGQEYTIPIDNLTDGLYLLQMRTATGLYSRKFVIHR